MKSEQLLKFEITRSFVKRNFKKCGLPFSTISRILNKLKIEGTV